MKNFLFYIIFLLSTINLSAQTYQYHPFIDTTKVWELIISGSDCNFPDDTYGYLYFKGDSVINGKTYKKLMQRNCAYFDPGGWIIYNYPSGLRMLFREDTLNRKLFYWDNVQNSESLYFNFNKQVGDSISIMPYSSTPAIISQIDTVTLFNGFLVKKFILSNGNFNGGKSYFYEYLGSYLNLDFPFDCVSLSGCGGEVYQFLNISFVDEDTLCQHFTSLSITNPKSTNTLFSILNESENSNEYTFSIFDYFGKIHLKTQTLKQSDLNDLPKGLYIVHIQKDNVFYSFKYPNL